MTQRTAIERPRARYGVAKNKIALLSRSIVCVPVIVHDIREQGSAFRMKSLRPLPPINIAEARHGSINRNDANGHVCVMSCHPMLNTEPFNTGTSHEIVGGVDPALLRRVRKLWGSCRYWKCEIDGLFLIGVVLVQTITDLDFLFAVKQQNFHFNCGCVQRGTRQNDGRSPRLMFRLQQLPVRCGINREFRIRQGQERFDDLRSTVGEYSLPCSCFRVPIAASYVQVLSKLIWAVGINQLALKLLVINMRDCSTRVVKGDSVERVLDSMAFRRRRARRRLLAILYTETFVAD